LKPFPALGEISSDTDNIQSHIQTACANGAPMKYTISGAPGMVYHWNSDLGNSVFKDSSGNIETDTLNNNILATWPKQANNHYLHVFGEDGGCYSFTKSLTVQVNNLPIVSLHGDVNLCQGQDYTFNIDTGRYKLITWSNQTTGHIYTTNKNDTVVVVVTDSKNCVGSDTAIVRVFPLPKVYLGKDTMLCGQSTLVLDAGNSGANYLWSNGGLRNDSLSQTITVDKTYGSNHISVLVTVNELPYNIECSNSDTIWIIKCNEIFAKDSIYTVFTPNGDGFNDSWKIPGLSDRPSDHPKAIVQVYDRWGRLVFQSQPGYPKDWDGRDANGKYLPMDNYYYIINLNEKNAAPVTGSITILR
jgi:gliding motility-associated-like protein